MATDSLPDVCSVRRGRGAWSRETALRGQTPRMGCQRQVLRPAHLPYGIRHRLAKRKNRERAAEETPVCRRRTAIQARFSDGRGPGFFQKDDRERSCLRLVQRGGRLRDRSGHSLAAFVHAKKGAAARKNFFGPPDLASDRDFEVGYGGSGLCGRL